MAVADVGQVLATGGTTIVGVATGAGLTYWFSALNRRHQEAREDATRWYEARLNSYLELSHALGAIAVLAVRGEPTYEERERSVAAVMGAIDSIRLVGSPEVVAAAERVRHVAADTLAGATAREPFDVASLRAPHREFRAAARKDLGHPPARPNNEGDAG
jgi:hypothetical protein